MGDWKNNRTAVGARFSLRLFADWIFRCLWLIFAIGCFAFSKNNSALFSFREWFNHFFPVQRLDIFLSDIQIFAQIYFGLFGFSFLSFFGRGSAFSQPRAYMSRPVSFIGRTVAEGNRFCAALCREEAVPAPIGSGCSFQNQFLS